VKVHTQEIPQELHLKSTVNFLKLMGNILCAAADMGIHDANAFEQLGRIPRGFSEG